MTFPYFSMNLTPPTICSTLSIEYKNSVSAHLAQILFALAVRCRQMLRSFLCFTFSISTVFSCFLDIHSTPKPEIQQMKQKRSFASFKLRGGKTFWNKEYNNWELGLQKVVWHCFFLDFVPENDRVIFEAKRMMQFLEKTLKLDPKPKSFVPPNLPNLSKYDLGGHKIKTEINSRFQDNIRQMTRLRVANVLRTRMAKNHNIPMCNENYQRGGKWRKEAK